MNHPSSRGGRAPFMNRRELIKRFGLAGIIAGALLDRRMAEAQNGRPPRRFVFFYIPGGLFPVVWQPEKHRSDLSADAPIGGLAFKDFFGHVKLGARRTVWDVFDDPALAPLKSELLVLDGVDMRSNNNGAGGDPHHNGIKAALRGYHNADAGAARGDYAGFSIDRYIGSGLYPGGTPAQTKSVCAAIRFAPIGYQGSIREAIEGYVGFETDSETQLWDHFFANFTPGGSTPAQPMGPSRELTRGYARRDLLNQIGQGELKTLMGALGSYEKETLERHLEAMSELHRQVKADYDAASAPTSGPIMNGAKVPGRPGGDLEGKRRLLDKYKTVNDIVANALAFNRTRVVNYFAFGQNNNDSFWYPNATGAFHDGVSHSGTSEPQRPVPDPVYNAGRVWLQAIGDLIAKLKAIPEGNGSVLDSTTIVTYVDMCHGDHAYEIPGPYLIAGGGGLDAQGRRHWKTGRYLKLNEYSSNDLFVSLAHCAGAEPGTSAALRAMTRFGNKEKNTHTGGGLPGLVNG